MNKRSKGLAIASYITWIGWLIAFFKRDRSDTLVRRHMNQALILNLIATVTSVIGRFGGIFRTVYFVVDLAVLVLIIMGILRASKGSEEPLPVIGGYTLID